MARTFTLANGRTIDLDDDDFRAILYANREAALRLLKVRRAPPGISFAAVGETPDGEPVTRVWAESETE